MKNNAENIGKIFAQNNYTMKPKYFVQSIWNYAIQNKFNSFDIMDSALDEYEKINEKDRNL